MAHEAEFSRYSTGYIFIFILFNAFLISTTDSDQQTSSTEVPEHHIASNYNHSTAIDDTIENSSLRVNQEMVRTQALCPHSFYHCPDLPAYCLKCEFDRSCWYGTVVNVTCRPADGVFCKLPSDPTQTISNENSITANLSSAKPLHTNYTVEKQLICRYCHQIAEAEMTCIGRTHCRQPEVPRSFYETLCEPKPHVLCMGRRVFRRMLPCNWSSGKRYVTTVFLSLFLGGFGVDRFYLGMWMEGLGKLLSFGGLGIWSVVDFILILAGYVKPPGDAVYW